MDKTVDVAEVIEGLQPQVVDLTTRAEKAERERDQAIEIIKSIQYDISKVLSQGLDSGL